MLVAAPSDPNFPRGFLARRPFYGAPLPPRRIRRRRRQRHRLRGGRRRQLIVAFRAVVHALQVERWAPFVPFASRVHDWLLGSTTGTPQATYDCADRSKSLVESAVRAGQPWTQVHDHGFATDGLAADCEADHIQAGAQPRPLEANGLLSA